MRTFFLLFTAVIIISSCNLDSTDSDSNYFSTNIVFISRDISSETGNGKEIQTLPSSSIDKVFFRSSDIEFWSIDNISDVDDLMSAAYHQENEVPDHLNKSINVELLDITETFVFIPGQASSFEAQNEISFEKKIYNLARLDIGGGEITFEINGEEKTVYFSTGDDTYLNCNSIFFVDSEYLDQVIYIDRDEAASIEDGSLTSGVEIIDAIILNSNYVDTFENGIIDVHGALFIPFEPIDFNNYEDITEVTADVSWDMENLVTFDDNGTPDDTSDDFNFRMVDRVEGTCFDFQIDIYVSESD